MKIFLGSNNIGGKLGSGKTSFGGKIFVSSTDTTPPSIIGFPTIDEITTTSFRVTWSLDEGSQGQIEYGSTVGYGSFTTREYNYLTTHIQTVSGLDENTEYHFRILGEDIFGNQLTSQDFTVSTIASGSYVASISATDNAASESPLTTGQFTIGLNTVNSTGNPIVINYTVSGTAIQGTDYQTLTGSVSIPNGQVSQTVTITPIDDSEIEVNETVVLTLAAGTGYTIGSPSSATVNITSEDVLVATSGISITSTDKTATKSPSITNGTFTITAPSPVTADTVINYTLSGSAINGVDYSTLSGTATILNGNTSTTVTINPINNDVLESEKVVILTLASGSGYTISNNGKWDYIVIGNNKTESLPTVAGTSIITSLSDFTNAANAGTTATVTGTFDATGAIAAAGMILVAGGGIISGTNINLNGSGIQNGTSQIFSTTARFSTLYDKSRLSPEVFGATANGIADDSNALDALIINCKHAIGTPLATYVRNQESTITRADVFDWNMNTAKVITTSDAALSHGTATSNSDQYLWMFTGNILCSIYNGEFDGQDTASRLIRLEDPQEYHFNNMNIHNYYAPPTAYARGVALRFRIREVFDQGFIFNSTIEHIGAASNGNANDAPYGISKGIWASCYPTTGFSGQYMADTTINDIYGDDAEGFYPARDGGYVFATSQINFYLNRMTFTACQRRAIKTNASNLQLTNSTLTSATNDWIFSGAQATTLHIFTLSTGQLIRNVNCYNNTISTIGDAKNALFGINDATECRIEDNIFTANYIGAQRSITFGVGSTQGGLYTGQITNTVTFKNNTTTNAFFGISNLYVPINGGLVFDNNTSHFDIDRNMGIYWASIRLIATSGLSNAITLSNWNITVNQTFSTGALFGGVFNTQGMEPQNMQFNNVNIDYTGSTSLPPYGFAYTGKNDTSTDFDSTNSITDCTITGMSGTGAVFVKGPDASVVITNSFGDGATPLTAQ